MSTEVRIPQIGFSSQEGTLTEWLVADGGQVEAGKPLYTLELDKSVQEVEAPASGTLKIRAATGHLKGVRIAVMGCIVNGPGEMADADFGYVGGAPGKINLYVGKEPVKFNLPEEEAVERLIDLIKEHGRWFEAPARALAEV